MNKAQSARIATEPIKLQGFNPKTNPSALRRWDIYALGQSPRQQHHFQRLLIKDLPS